MSDNRENCRELEDNNGNSNCIYTTVTKPQPTLLCSTNSRTVDTTIPIFLSSAWKSEACEGCLNIT